MTSKLKDIHIKSPFNKVTKCERVHYYKILRKIHRKIQSNASTIQSKLGGGNNVIIGMEMQTVTNQIVTGHEFERPTRPPQADPVPTNAFAAEVPRFIQQHACHVDQWRQMVNA